MKKTDFLEILKTFATLTNTPKSPRKPYFFVKKYRKKSDFFDFSKSINERTFRSLLWQSRGKDSQFLAKKITPKNYFFKNKKYVFVFVTQKWDLGEISGSRLAHW